MDLSHSVLNNSAALSFEDVSIETRDEVRSSVKYEGGETALFHAARNGRLRAYDQLIASGADEEIRNGGSHTVLNVVRYLSMCTGGIRECITFIAAEKENNSE